MEGAGGTVGFGIARAAEEDEAQAGIGVRLEEIGGDEVLRAKELRPLAHMPSGGKAAQARGDWPVANVFRCEKHGVIPTTNSGSIRSCPLSLDSRI